MLENSEVPEHDGSKRQTRAQQFFKGQTKCSFFLLRGSRCKVQAEQGSVALGEGSQKHILFKFNGMVTVSLSKLQLNINSSSSRD